MNEKGKKLLHLMFKESESVCVSPSKYGYHSIPLKNVLNDKTLTLIPTEESCLKRNIKPEDAKERCSCDDMTLVALNPINGFRSDANCTAYRNFLVEIDDFDLKEQIEYIKRLGLPYSAIVFSGNKSMHFLVSLSEDLPNEKIWRMFAEWILNVVTLADNKTKNPSRSIRIPGVFREPGKLQRLVEIKPAITQKQLLAWLSKHPNAKPQKPQKRLPAGDFDFRQIKPWVKTRLINGVDRAKGRNQQWYAIAVEFALCGYNEDVTLEVLSEFFTPERDFKKKEWEITIKSAFKRKL